MSIFGRLWTPGGSGEGGNDRSFVGTGLGWYLDSDYLRTLGSQTLATIVVPGNNPLDLPLYTGTLNNMTRSDGVLISTGDGKEYYEAKVTDKPVARFYATDSNDTMIGALSDYPVTIYGVSFYIGGGAANRNSFTIPPRGGNPYDAPYAKASWTERPAYINPQYNVPIQGGFNATVNHVYHDYYQAGASTTSTITKVQGGAGAFAFTKFPVSGVDTYVGLGVSSVAGNAEIAVDGTSTSYTTRTLDSTTFTMYYTDQLTGEMIAYVPVIEVASMPSISNLSDYQTALFNAIVGASGLSVIT